MNDFKRTRKDVINTLNEIADKLDATKGITDKATKWGAATTAAGAGLWITGIALTPFPSGLSLGLVGVGKVVAGFGGATMLGSQAWINIQEWKEVEKVKKLLKEDQEALQRLQNDSSTCVKGTAVVGLGLRAYEIGQLLNVARN